MIRDDSTKNKSPFGAFLAAFRGDGADRPARLPVARPAAARPATPTRKRPCNCTGKRRA